MTTSENGLPLLDGGPTPQEQSYPQTSVQMSPQGLAIIITLAPGYSHQFVLGEAMMNDVTKMWVQQRKNIADQMRVIEHVRNTKIN